MITLDIFCGFTALPDIQQHNSTYHYTVHIPFISELDAIDVTI